MPVSAGESLDPERTRQRIATTAAEAFYERGVAAVSVNEIAQRAGASKETIYRAFGNRQGLIDAAIDTRAAQNEHRLGELAATYPDPADRLAALVRWHGSWYETKDFLGCPIVRAVMESAAPLHEAGASHLQRYRAFLSVIIDELNLPAERTTQILGLIEGATILAAIEGPQAGRTVLNAVGLLAAPTKASARTT